MSNINPNINNIGENLSINGELAKGGFEKSQIKKAPNGVVLNGAQSLQGKDDLSERNILNLQSKQKFSDGVESLFNKGSGEAEHFENKEKSDREHLKNAQTKTFFKEGEVMSTPKSEAQIEREGLQEGLDVLLKQEGVTQRQNMPLSAEEELEAQLDEADDEEGTYINDENTGTGNSDEDILDAMKKSITEG